MRKVLLDTNAYSRLRGGDQELLDTLGEADIVFMSVFVLGELYAAFKGGSREKENRAGLAAFLDKPIVKRVFATDETAEVFAAIKDALRRQGTPLPTNDIWIAAHAVESGATLLTYDAHFRNVKGLRRWPAAT